MSDEDKTFSGEPVIAKPSIVDPAAEAAHRHLSWSPDMNKGKAPSGLGDKPEPEPSIFDIQDFISYVGYADGSFEVRVDIQRGNTAAAQTERGIGEHASDIRDTMLKSYEKADRALTAISTPAEEI